MSSSQPTPNNAKDGSGPKPNSWSKSLALGRTNRITPKSPNTRDPPNTSDPFNTRYRLDTHSSLNVQDPLDSRSPPKSVPCQHQDSRMKDRPLKDRKVPWNREQELLDYDKYITGGNGDQPARRGVEEPRAAATKVLPTSNVDDPKPKATKATSQSTIGGDGMSNQSEGYVKVRKLHESPSLVNSSKSETIGTLQETEAKLATSLKAQNLLQRELNELKKKILYLNRSELKDLGVVVEYEGGSPYVTETSGPTFSELKTEREAARPRWKELQRQLLAAQERTGRLTAEYNALRAQAQKSKEEHSKEIVDWEGRQRRLASRLRKREEELQWLHQRLQKSMHGEIYQRNSAAEAYDEIRRLSHLLQKGRRGSEHSSAASLYTPTPRPVTPSIPLVQERGRPAAQAVWKDSLIEPDEVVLQEPLRKEEPSFTQVSLTPPPEDKQCGEDSGFEFISLPYLHEERLDEVRSVSSDSETERGSVKPDFDAGVTLSYSKFGYDYSGYHDYDRYFRGTY
ncbi:hypothetical protein F5Y16DRAFT_403277 [Xylariaceae sp. FL0255]|nr:hypothetical protein F5Y16DRAFT_403277 [Xylariaceae sp. FL0255]